MTFPMQPAPRLSEAARPYVPRPLPEPGPDHDKAAQAFSGQSVQEVDSPLRERDLRERELLGMAMASPHGLAALQDLRPAEFAIPVNQNVARVIMAMAEVGDRPDAAAVTTALREQALLPRELDPLARPQADPRETGLGSWQTMALAPETRAPTLAREIRSLYRQDTLVAVAQAAIQQYEQGLLFDTVGRMEADRLGVVTKELADQLVSLPKELHPEWGHDVDRSVETWENNPSRSRPTATDLDLPASPTLSSAARRAIRPAVQG